MSDQIVLTTVVLTYGTLVREAGCPPAVIAGILAEDPFSAQFDIRDMDEAIYLTTQREQNFTPASRVELVRDASLPDRTLFISAPVPFTATLYGGEQPIRRVAVATAVDQDGIRFTTAMVFDGGGVVSNGGDVDDILARIGA
jgi:hypothetical protein